MALALVVAAATIPAIRHSLLQSAGWLLVAEDPVTPADIIVISTDSREAGMLEAADLVHSGFAPGVALFDLPPGRLSQELARRGAEPFESIPAFTRLLRQLGVADVTVIPAVVGTVDEGRVLQRWCAAHSIHSILFVSAPDHSRRARRVLARALGPSVQVRVRYTRFAEFDPDSWWQTRSGQRTELMESEKLLLDLVMHPF